MEKYDPKKIEQPLYQAWESAGYFAPSGQGEPFSIELEDHPAVVAQHECDHLQGILYVDRAEPFTLSFLEEYRKFGHLLWKFIDDESEMSEEV